MARDYKNAGQKPAKKRKPRQSGGGVPGVVWLLAGLAMGLGVAWLVHLSYQGKGPFPELAKHRPTAAEMTARANTSASDDAPADEGPEFEFYKILPQMEVKVPDTEPLPERKTAAERDADKPEPAERYLLQAGSFQNKTDAERFKAQIALDFGLQSHIQSVELKGGETWHRVYIGPFAGLVSLDKARAELKAKGVDTILLKAKAG